MFSINQSLTNVKWSSTNIIMLLKDVMLT